MLNWHVSRVFFDAAGCFLSLSVQEKAMRLSLGDPIVDIVFPGFDLGDFAVLFGNAAVFMSFVLSVRCLMPTEEGGLNSAVVFADGGNTFDLYLIGEIARSYGLNPRRVLEKIYVSRAFTAYQFTSLILEKLEIVLRQKRARLLVVSDVASLFLDKDVPKTEAEDLFLKVCVKLSQISANKQAIVAATYLHSQMPMQSLRFRHYLFGHSNVIAEVKGDENVLSLILEDHQRIKAFSRDFSAEFAPLMAFGRCNSWGEQFHLIDRL
jgi:hypothetical protein